MEMRSSAGEFNRALYEADGHVDKVGMAGRSREEGSVSSEGSSTSKRMSLASDMSKEQIEQLVTRMTIDEKSRWFDEIILAKFRTELVESPQLVASDTIDTPSTEDNPSPRCMPIDIGANPQRPYQATVEDDPEELQLSGSSNQTRVPASEGRNKGDSSTDSSVVSDSTSSRVSNRPPTRRFSEATPRRQSESIPITRPTVRFSDRVPVILNTRGPSTQPRDGPPPIRLGFPSRVPKAELSAVDASWGHLFDEKGDPTPRLGRFVRGLANYIIAEYTPTNSLVLTPDKLLAFYRQFKLGAETMPFEYMFDLKSSRDYKALEGLYQDLGCSYHLVQAKPNSTPRVPALTPEGFQEWATRQIQAFPDQESQRLNCIISELPITADEPLADGKAERLPRQLSRHLLPATAHTEVHDKVLVSVHRWVKDIGLEDAIRKDAVRKYSADQSQYHPSSRPRDEKSGRYRPEDYRGGDRTRHKARESHGKPSDREPPPRQDAASGRFAHRANSEGNVRRSDVPPPIITSGKSRSPTSRNRYRVSGTSINSAGGTDEYGLSSSHASRGERRSREQEYRFYQGRMGSDSTPRTVVGGTGGSKRQSLVLEASPRDRQHDDYSRESGLLRNPAAADDSSYRAHD